MPRSAPPYHSDVAISQRRDHPFASRLPKLVIGDDWGRWLADLSDALDRAPERIAHVSLSAQAAAIATTAIPLATIGPGVWRISYTVRVTQAATTSSEVRVTIAWTEGGVAQSQQGALLNGNLTTTREGASHVIRVDQSTPITYAVSYASVGATSAMFSLDVIAEELAMDGVSG